MIAKTKPGTPDNHLPTERFKFAGATWAVQERDGLFVLFNETQGTEVTSYGPDSMDPKLKDLYEAAFERLLEDDQ